MSSTYTIEKVFKILKKKILNLYLLYLEIILDKLYKQNILNSLIKDLLVI